MIDWWVYPIVVAICVLIIFWKEITTTLRSSPKWLDQTKGEYITESYIDSFAPVVRKIEETPPTQKTIKLFKCSQCGGILKSSVCDYCGSKYGTITDLKPVPVIPERNTVIMEML
jgi:hypothetical protein